MPDIAAQIDRIQFLLQDTDAVAWSRDNILVQHQDEMVRLAREGRIGDVVILQGVADQALYTLPQTPRMPELVLYNGLRLSYATEEFLDRKDRLWEWRSSQEPKYWTTNNQNPETLRIAPAPARTGATLPQIPPSPFVMTYVDNLVIFLPRDVSNAANNEADVLPVLDVWEDVLVFRTAAELARRETPYQNLPLSQTLHALAELWMGLIE
jgi:hypothetical protein